MRTTQKAAMVPLILIAATIFSGCSLMTKDGRQEFWNETVAMAKNAVTEQGKELLSQAKDVAIEKAAEVADSKIAEYEASKLEDLNEALAIFKKKDPITGVEKFITWKNFDADGNESLGASEIASASRFIAVESAKGVISGELSGSDVGNAAKGGGLALAALLALAAAKKGVDKIRGKNKKDDQALAAGDNPQPAAPARKKKS